MNNNENENVFYKLGKAFRGIGSWLIWGTILCPVFTVISFSIWSYVNNIYVSILGLIIGFIFLGASFVFLILLGIYTIKMISRGYKTAFTLKIREYKLFSNLTIISLITSSFMYIFIIIGFTNTLFYDPLDAFFDWMLNIFGNVFLFLPFLGSIAGSILRMIAWYHLKIALKVTSNDPNIQIAVKRSQLMFVTQIFLGVSGPLSLIAVASSTDPIFMLILLVSYVIFYVLKISAYRSIGKHLKRVSSDSIILQKSIISKQPQPYKSNNIQKESRDIHCSQCGALNPRINAFCLYCGEELK